MKSYLGDALILYSKSEYIYTPILLRERGSLRLGLDNAFILHLLKDS
jgi:hypothetical protein